LPVHRPSEKARSKDHRPHQHEDNENHDRQDPLTCLPVMKTLVTGLRHLVDGRKRAPSRAVPWAPPFLVNRHRPRKAVREMLVGLVIPALSGSPEHHRLMTTDDSMICDDTHRVTLVA
jgi:hypothetical protein